MEIKLDVGSGRFPKQGYTSVDKFGNPDILADMWNIPLESESVHVVRSSHALEHVHKHFVMPSLREWYRLLIPGGKLELCVPDLEWCIRAWLKNPTNEYELDCIFGMQSYDGVITHEGEIHYTGFSKELLEEYVSKAGFQNIVSGKFMDHNMGSIWLDARK